MLNASIPDLVNKKKVSITNKRTEEWKNFQEETLTLRLANLNKKGKKERKS